MTPINKILSRANCGSNHAATGVYQGDVLSPRYRVRVDPKKDLFCVFDRQKLAYIYLHAINLDCVDWYRCTAYTHQKDLYWPDFDDALAFAKLLDKAVTKAELQQAQDLLEKVKNGAIVIEGEE